MVAEGTLAAFVRYGAAKSGATHIPQDRHVTPVFGDEIRIKQIDARIGPIAIASVKNVTKPAERSPPMRVALLLAVLVLGTLPGDAVVARTIHGLPSGNPGDATAPAYGPATIFAPAFGYDPERHAGPRAYDPVPRYSERRSHRRVAPRERPLRTRSAPVPGASEPAATARLADPAAIQANARAEAERSRATLAEGSAGATDAAARTKLPAPVASQLAEPRNEDRAVAGNAGLEAFPVGRNEPAPWSKLLAAVIAGAGALALLLAKAAEI